MPNITPELFDLTCGQRYLVHRLEKNPALAKPLQRVYLLSQDFNYIAFNESIQHAFASHPSLRLQLLKFKDTWKQYFSDQEINIPQIEVKGITRLYRTIYAKLLIAEETKKAFNLSSKAPVKAKIIKVNGQRLLSLCIDHIAVDGISFDLLERTLLNTYQQALKGLPFSKASSEAFFKYLLKEASQQQFEQGNLLYWQQHLKDSLMKMDYKTKFSNVPANAFKCHFNGQSFSTLSNFCQTNNCSIFTILIAIQLLILSDITELDNIILGIPVSNRASAEEERIIANLVMPLYVSFPIIPNEPIFKFLFRIRGQFLNALLHKQYDFPSLAQFFVKESRENNRKIIFNKECNLITDTEPMTYPNMLFANRLDNDINIPLKITKSGFSIEAIQTATTLDIEIRWDNTTWPIPSSTMISKFQNTLHKIYEM
jgi:hypothetical protein